MKGMQNKTIKKVIGKKIEDWIVSIEDVELQRSVRKDVIVTGGSIASLIMGDPVNDFDVYFKTKETTKKVAEYYVNKFNQQNKNSIEPYVTEQTIRNIKGVSEDRVVIWVQSSGVAASDDYQVSDDDTEEPENTIDSLDNDEEKYRPVFLSENAVTLSHKMQIITRFYGEPDELHDNFDFVHACCYYRHYTNELVTPLEALRSMQSMTLKYRGSLYPVCSLFRLRKFISRGWTISAGEILKIAMQISDIDLNNIATLKEQLTGVDALYFHMLLDAIQKQSSEDGYISTPYVIEVIDRIFSND